VPGEISFPPHKSFEFLKKVAIDCAEGEWCVWWADDCWFAPGYVRAHMRAADKLRYTQAWEVTACAAGTGRVTTCRVNNLTGFFRFNPRPKECHVIDGREMVLRWVHEH